jgi:hypothetical protein
MRRNHLKGRQGDGLNAVLAAAGYNFSLLLRWFRSSLRTLLLILARASCRPASPKNRAQKHSSRSTISFAATVRK